MPLNDQEFSDVLDGRRKFAYIENFIESSPDEDDPDDVSVKEDDFWEWINQIGVKPLASTAEGDYDGYKVFVRVLEPLSPEAEPYRSDVVDSDAHFDSMMRDMSPWPEI